MLKLFFICGRIGVGNELIIMNENFDRAKQIITGSDVVFAYVCGHEEIVSSAKGIGFVASLCDEKRDLSRGVVADKIVGKAAAMLFVLLGVKVVYAEVLSMGGKAVFERYGVEFSYGVLTESIQNRKGDGLCPMENAVKNTDKPKEAHRAVNEALAHLRLQNSQN